MKKILFIIGVLMIVPTTVLAAPPSYRFERTLLPEVNLGFDLGTTTFNWRSLFVNQICLSADTCRTTWPTGGGGGSGGGTWSTSTNSAYGGVFNNYTNNTTDIVEIGGTATTSAKTWFDPNAGTASIMPNGTTTLGDTFTRQDTSCINVLEGDSLTDNAAQPNDWSSWIAGYDNDFGKCRTVNIATTGDTMSNILSTYTAQITPWKPIYTSDRRTLFLWACTNDLNNGDSGATCYASLKAVAQKAKADGFKVVVFTTLQRQQFITTPSKENQRYILNNLILADANTGLFDLVIQPDLALPTYTDATYFSDSTHLTALGGQLVARIVSKSLHYIPWTIMSNRYATTTASNVAFNGGGNTLFGNVTNQIDPSGSLVTIAATSTNLGSNLLNLINTASTSILSVTNGGLTIVSQEAIGTSTISALYEDIGPVTTNITEAYPTYSLGVHAQNSASTSMLITNSAGVSRAAGIMFKGSTSVNNRFFTSGCIYSGLNGTAYSQSYTAITSASAANVCRNLPDLIVTNSMVGIGGTTTPDYPLDVRGTAKIENSSNPLLDILESTSGSSRRGRLSYDTTNNLFVINGTTGTGQSPSISFQIGGTEYMRVWGNLNSSGLANLGNIGIGTSSPGTKLAVVGDGYITGRVTANNFVATSTITASIFPNASTTQISASNYLKIGTAIPLQLNSFGSGPVDLQIDKNINDGVGVQVQNVSTGNLALSYFSLANANTTLNVAGSAAKYSCNWVMGGSGWDGVSIGFGSLPANASATYCTDGDYIIGSATSSPSHNVGNVRLYGGFTGSFNSGVSDAVLSDLGFWGVGTTTPGTPLSIVGDSYITGQETARRFVSTSTISSNIFPYASTTAVSATTICLTGDTCRTTWPTGGAGITGTIGQVAYFSGTNNAIGTSSLNIGINQLVGVGTSSPFAMLSIHHPALGLNIPLFLVASSTATATSTLFQISNTGLASTTSLLASDPTATSTILGPLAVGDTSGLAATAQYTQKNTPNRTNLFNYISNANISLLSLSDATRTLTMPTNGIISGGSVTMVSPSTLANTNNVAGNSLTLTSATTGVGGFLALSKVGVGNVGLINKNGQTLFGGASSTPYMILGAMGTTTNGGIASTTFAVIPPIGQTAPLIDVFDSITVKNKIWSVLSSGAILSTSTAPVLSSCGTNPTVVGGTNWGEVTAGATASGCTVTFATAFPTFASCTVTPQTGSIVNTFSYTVSASAIVTTETGLGGNKFNYTCDGN